MTDNKLLTAAEGATLLGTPQEISTAPTKTAPTPFRTIEQREQDTAKQFKQDTAQHQMTILHDEDLYRHLRFRSPKNSLYWFDLVTWPGSLVIRGDVNGYMFTRLRDMFEFFRNDGYGINPHYWAEKLENSRDSAQEYSEDLFRQLVVEHTVDAIRYGDAPRGIGKAVREGILNSEFLTVETEARDVLGAFEYEGFRFTDTWEWDFRDYDWSFIWACHAVQWGIGQYDAARQAVAS